MYKGLLDLHSVLRYLLLIAAIWAIAKMASGMNGKKTFTNADKRPAMFFMILMDIQFLIGLYLYFFGPMGYKLFQVMPAGEVMKNDVSRFFAIEHITGMIISLVLVHIGYATIKKNIPDVKKFKKGFWYFLIALIIMLASIPWPFRDLGRGWFPGMS